ncbi:hypothetical protein JRO89_XS12G0253900 [Xanthoceras sorbifolium]|uniref:Translation initiation factor IF2/IF5 domain-containing protein n=1 Tax=Xanthoceras sorbifolium TaxID=99658 RepID=A0ABQ8HDS8_9ROSI|nr:hypothetical protein JRO89_XS12G0253900 [Xanthoceras sorbifolium]
MGRRGPNLYAKRALNNHHGPAQTAIPKRRRLILTLSLPQTDEAQQSLSILDCELESRAKKKKNTTVDRGLLSRVFDSIRENNPELAGERRSTVMRPPQVLREGTKKTVFVNFMEMGTSGSLDGQKQLVVKDRFASKNMNMLYLSTLDSLVHKGVCVCLCACVCMQSWIQEMAVYVKSMDPKHLVEIGLEGFYGPSAPEKAQFNPNSYATLVGTDFIRNQQVIGVDFASVHNYADSWISQTISDAHVQFTIMD